MPGGGGGSLPDAGDGTGWVMTNLLAGNDPKNAGKPASLFDDHPAAKFRAAIGPCFTADP
jgi:hypothetical protein